MARTKPFRFDAAFYADIEAKEATQFSAWGKMEFLAYPAKPWAEILPLGSEAVRDLVSRLVRYESTERLKAGLVSVPCTSTILIYLAEYQHNVEKQVLEHAFFQESTPKT